MIKTMRTFIVKDVDIKSNQSKMYIFFQQIINDICQYTFIIQGKINKEYRIRFSYSNYEFINVVLLSIILCEDISTIYYDPYNIHQLIELLKRVSFVKLKELHGHEIPLIKDLENELKIKEDNIIDIYKNNKNI